MNKLRSFAWLRITSSAGFRVSPLVRFPCQIRRVDRARRRDKRAVGVGRGTLDSKLKAAESAVIERHALCRQPSAVHEVHAYAAGLEKRSRHYAPTALRIPLVASLADDLGSVVTERPGVSAPHD